MNEPHAMQRAVALATTLALGACASRPIETPPKPAPNTAPSTPWRTYPLDATSTPTDTFRFTQVVALEGGDLLVAGATDGDTTFAPTPSARHDWLGVVARLSAAGDVVWSRAEPNTTIAIASTNGRVLAGFAKEDGMLRPKGSPPEESGSTLAFVELDPLTGTTVRSHERIIGGNPAMTWGLEIRARGEHAVLAMHLSNVALVGDATFEPSGGIDSLVSWYDTSDASLVADHTFEGPKNSMLEGIELLEGGDVVVAGDFQESAILAGAPALTCEKKRRRMGEHACGVLARLSPTKGVVWSRTLSSEKANLSITHMTPTPNGRVVIAAETFHGREIDLGLGPRSLPPSNYATIMTFDVDADGTTHREHVFETVRADLDVTALTTTPRGDVVLGLRWREIEYDPAEAPTLTLTDGTLTNAGGTRALVVAIAPDGSTKLVDAIDSSLDAGEAHVHGLAFGAGRLVAAGELGGALSTQGAPESTTWVAEDEPTWPFIKGLRP